MGYKKVVVRRTRVTAVAVPENNELFPDDREAQKRNALNLQFEAISAFLDSKRPDPGLTIQEKAIGRLLHAEPTRGSRAVA